MAMTYAEKLRDPRWQKKRLQILERDEWTCQFCKETTETLHIHHFKYGKGEPWEVEDEYLITLCKWCHEVEELNLSNARHDINKMIREEGLTSTDLHLIARIIISIESVDPELREVLLTRAVREIRKELFNV